MPTRTLRVTLLTLTLILAVTFVACGSASTSDNNSPAGAGLPIDDTAAENRDKSVSADSGGANPADTSGLLDRKIIRTASLSLAVENILDGVRQVEDVADAAGGFVSNSSVSTDSDDSVPQAALITIRVPADSYAATIKELRGLAESVRSESSETSEVTEEYVDLQSRLRNLEATEDQYLNLLKAAKSIDDILTVQDRLNGVRAEIEQVTGRINALDGLIELATINVKLELPIGGEEGSSGHWATRAWETSWEASTDVAVVVGSVAIGLGVLAIWLLPFAVVAGLGWFLFGRRVADIVTRLRGDNPRPPSTIG